VMISPLNGSKIRNRVPQIEAKERVVDALKDINRYSTGRKLNYIIFRPSCLFKEMSYTFDQALKGNAYMPGNGSYQLNPIHPDDFADAIVDVIDHRDKNHNREISIGGPETFTMKQIIEIAFRIAKRNFITITTVPNWFYEATSSLTKPFNEKVSNEVSMSQAVAFSGVGQKSVGKHKLEDYFSALYVGTSSKSRPGSNEVIVHSESYFEQSIEVKGQNKTIKWEFSTLEYDIGFTVLHNFEGVQKSKIFEMKRYNSHLEVITGEFTTTTDGVYVLRWDNTFSKFRKKLLTYKVSEELVSK